MTNRDWMLVVIASGFALLLLGADALDLSDSARIWVKGAAVGTLTIAALSAARTIDGALLALFLLLSTLGDVLIEFDLRAGGAAFACAHGIAILLFLRNRRDPKNMPTSQKLAALAILLFAPLIYLLAGTPELGLAFYALILVAMAASAWSSQFSRYRTGIGALLFVASDALIFARLGGRISGDLVDTAIWIGYFTAQALIFVGVRSVLGNRNTA